MSLLSIAQQVLKSIPVNAPTTIVGNNDSDATMVLACAQEEGESLARRPSLGWLAMQREFEIDTTAVTTTGHTTLGSAIVTAIPSTAALAALTFYCTGTGIPQNTTILTVDSATQVTLNHTATATGTVALVFGKSDYALPTDFQRMVDGTLWDRSRYWEMRGPLSPQQWQLYKSSVIGRASIQRRWRIRRIGGNNLFSVDPTPGDSNGILVFEYVSNAWCASATGTLQTTWLADTDVGIVDEYLLRLGIKWRFLERLGMNYVSAADEYERQVAKAMAADGGAAVLNLAAAPGTPLISPYLVQEGNYGS